MNEISSNYLAPSPSSSLKVSDLMIDQFSDDRALGKVLGTRSSGGEIRLGIDSEGVIGIDHGALRFQPLLKPEWGKCGIAYGPYQRSNGLTFGVYLLNGHNASQAEPLPERFMTRLNRWAIGSETERARTRLTRLVGTRQSKLVLGRLWQWFRMSVAPFGMKRIDENLAIGWFLGEITRDPLQEGNAFVMHSLGAECSELWARSGTSLLKAIRGLQNVPIYYFVVLRDRGAAYYAASMRGVPDLGTFPTMRLLTIDAFQSDPTVYAGIHQSVLGQIGFRVDTRVYGAQVAILPEFAQWYGSAHAADELGGSGQLHLSEAEIGGRWTVYEGEFQRSGEGSCGGNETNTALLIPGSPSGLIHFLVRTGDQPVEGVGIIWRARDEDNYWRFEAGSRECRLSIKQNGVWARFPATTEHHLGPNIDNAFQVVDDGERISLYLNGDLVYNTRFADDRLQDGTGVGFGVTGAGEGIALRSFEAHPRVIPIPESFNLGSLWCLEGNQVVASDDFAGPAAELGGRKTGAGGHCWSRTLGKGVFRLTGAGAVRVDASVSLPNPGRTAYSIPWEYPEFADLKVSITPPGKNKGQDERGRGGLIFWQDPDNYITLNLWMSDDYGFSISSFFRIDAYEELYDAVWTNIGNRVRWGVPFDFRVTFDGNHYLAKVNEEPVLYRALTDIYPDLGKLAIRRVGILANWEWGNDTGSVFENFVARAAVHNASDHNDD